MGEHQLARLLRLAREDRLDDVAVLVRAGAIVEALRRGQREMHRRPGQQRAQQLGQLLVAAQLGQQDMEVAGEREQAAAVVGAQGRLLLGDMRLEALGGGGVCLR